MIYIGIDPGKKGGIAILDENNSVCAYPFSEEILVDTALALKVSDKPIIAAVEKVGAMPHQGVKSMFTFGQGFGFIQGVLSALKIPFQLVPPQKWKKEFSLSSDKKQSVTVCKRLFPDLLLIPGGCRKENDGMAEAALIAEYAKRKF